MTDDVLAAYGQRAEEYSSLLGSMDATHELDRTLVSRWAGGVSGRLIDAGCGPGQWTDFLRSRGCDVEGIDLVPTFVDLARARFPGVGFRVAELDRLGVPDRSVAGILAWYSIIHTAPRDVPGILGEFARCLVGGGTLLLAIFEGARIEPFPHAVTTAYFWSIEEISRRLLEAGFRVEATDSRVDPGRRPHVAILARRVCFDE